MYEVTAKIICQGCNKLMRTEKWQMISESEPMLESHGICKECMKKYYPKIYRKKYGEK